MHAVETMAYVGQVPWHGLGTKVDEHMTAAEALVAGGLDWEVKLAPAFHHNGQQFVEVPGQHVTYRQMPDGRQDPLGTVGDYFHPYQNHALLELLDEIAPRGIECVGSLFDGRKVWGLLRMDGYAVGGIDQVDSFVLSTTDHTGGGATVLMETDIRVVCANTLRWSLDKGTTGVGHKVRHTVNQATRLAQARDAIRLAQMERDLQRDKAEALILRPFTMADVKRLAMDLFPVDEDAKSFIQDRQEANQVGVISVWKGSDNLDNIRGTAWGAYNAVVEYVDFGGLYSYRDSKVGTAAENRFANIIGGNSRGARVKQKAMALVSK